MVSVSHAIAHNDSAPPVDMLAEGLTAAEREQLEKALVFAMPIYADHMLGTGEEARLHATGMALIASVLRLDVESRIAALLYAVDSFAANMPERIETQFGSEVAALVDGLRKFKGLRLSTRASSKATAPEIHAQHEVLRKMMLAMVQDIRVVLLRLASRTQTLRYLTDGGAPDELRAEIARESLNIYSPLANRLGVWQLKWELEDLSFRFLEPDTYKRIARMLDERRVEREEFIQRVIERLENELKNASIKGEVFGRPKHIYSIYNKMRSKKLDFAQVYDIRAVRVLVNDIQDCYKVLDIVNHIWQPIAEEYDDYISRPKGNNYRSLHTALRAEDGRALEVQIRTYEMHKHAELGIAAHWRYKEGGGSHGGEYDDKIALLRSLLSWRDEIVDSSAWVEQFRRASFDDTIYVLTPQGRVVDLVRGATPVDFAYCLHTEVGHHCRGAKVDGHLVPLNTVLENGQTVEIITAKEGGPSRDWLNPLQGYVATGRARNKIRRYFSQLEEDELLARGRSVVTREMQREGHAQANIDNLAGKLGFKNADAMFVAAARGEVGPRAMQIALREDSQTQEPPPEPEMVVGRSRSGDSSDKVLINGVGKLMTTLSRCCKPAPPDAIQGFVTRGRGVSIHRVDCPDFQRLRKDHPERVVEAQWGQNSGKDVPSVFPVDVEVEAGDRQGLLRDISEVLSREKLNVTGVNTLTKKGTAFMRFTMEVTSVSQLQRAITAIREVRDVVNARRK